MAMQFSDLVDFKSSPHHDDEQVVHGTTVLALRYQDGIVVLADRRATMGILIMYEEAEKIEVLDDQTVVAISGAYARSIEVCRFLKHAFKYYERLNQFQISTEGKLMEISKALAGNMEAAMNGGIFLPIAAVYDPKEEDFSVHFFDAAGARFPGMDYATAGSGSERIRGVFEYLCRTKGPWKKRKRDDVLLDALVMLDIASSLDSATGGFQRRLPSVVLLTREGIERLPEKDLEKIAKKALG